MNKAVLVIDEPRNCIECPLCQTRRNTYYCGNGYTGERGDLVFDIIAKFDEVLEGKEIPKPDSCPLKALPERRSVNYMMDDVDIGEVIGWNAYRDELLGNY